MTTIDNSPNTLCSQLLQSPPPQNNKEIPELIIVDDPIINYKSLILEVLLSRSSQLHVINFYHKGPAGYTSLVSFISGYYMIDQIELIVLKESRYISGVVYGWY